MHVNEAKSASRNRQGGPIAARVRLNGFVFVLLMAGASSAATFEELVDRAGNASSDLECLNALRELRQLPDLPSNVQADADRLIKEIAMWTQKPRLDYFGHQIHLKGDYGFAIDETSPLHPLTDIYRARMLTWYTLEHGGLWNHPDKRRQRFDSIRALLQRAAQRFPQNPILRMYLGTPILPDRNYAPDPNAPDRANAQREALERLTDIIYWWIDHRMQPDGQFGGGWGDDCEMWRWWAPVLVGFYDPKLVEAQARFSRALLSQPHMTSGYTDILYDAEHTSEDSADTLTPMMLLEPNEPEWRNRALRIAELMRDRWTGRNERGQLQFKSSYFSGTEIDLTPKRAVDTFYSVRAVQPALLVWQQTKDPELARLFTDWLDTWVDASMREERGKPAGIVPSAIRWPDGAVGGVGERWWDPENHSDDPLYVWPNAMPLILHAMLLAYHMTGETNYLRPIRAMAELRMRRFDAPGGDAREGGEAWCSAQLGGITSALGKLWMLGAGDEYEAILLREGPEYLQCRIAGNQEALSEALERTAAALRVNFPGYTSEVRYTDRVLRFPTLFGENGMYPEGRPGIFTPDTELLYSSVTGDPSNPQVFPLIAVRWLTPPRDIAALVIRSGTNRFEAELYHFGENLRNVSAALPLLQPGTYTFSAAARSKERGSIEIARSELAVGDTNARITIDVPPRTLCTIRIIAEGGSRS